MTATLSVRENIQINVASMCDTVMAQTKPKPCLMAKHPGNWPNDAVFAVEYQMHDSQFPNVRHEKTVKYFPNEENMKQWFEEQREWIEGTDYDFSIQYAIYEWDLGPEFKSSGSM